MSIRRESIDRHSSGTIETLDDLETVSPRGEMRHVQSVKDMQDSGFFSTTGISLPPSTAEQNRATSMIFDNASVIEGYDSVPILEVDHLPRGGISIATKGVGRIQFGIPPETIKDSMQMGIEVPRVYIVPAERFCRDMGPSLGINLAEFEFPAYFNFFVRQKKCLLLVDSEEAESDIRKVFEETLLGPRQFRDDKEKRGSVDEDFDPSFPIDARPNFYEELKHFRILDKENRSSEMTTDMLIEFAHFRRKDALDVHDDSATGVPPIPAPAITEPIAVKDKSMSRLEESFNSLNQSEMSLLASPGIATRIKNHGISRSVDDIGTLPSTGNGKNSSTSNVFNSAPAGDIGASPSRVHTNLGQVGERGRRSKWLYSKVKWLGEKATIWPMDATAEQIENRSAPRVEIFRMQGGAEYVLHEVDANNYISGKVRFSGNVRVPDEIAVEGFLSLEEGSDGSVERPLTSLRTFHPPSFGVTVLGNSHGFDKNGSTSGYVLWINGRGVMIDPPPYSSSTLEREGILPQMIIGVIITHCHADHDAGAFQKILTGSRVAVITSPSIYKSFIRKYAALSGLKPSLLRHCHRFRPAIIGQCLRFQGAVFRFTYSLHTIPCLAFRAEWRGHSMVFTGDHLNLPPLISELESSGVLSHGRAEDLRRLPLQDCDILLHEAGAPPVHTPLSVLQELPDKIKQRMYVVHTSALPDDSGLRVAPVGTEHTIRLSTRNVSYAGSPKSTPPSPLVRKVDHFFTDVSAGKPKLPPVLERLNMKDMQDGGNSSLTFLGEFTAPNFTDRDIDAMTKERIPALAILRPSDITDAWFLLNLLSNVPFFSNLSYPNAMEVLEISKVKVYCPGDIVVHAGSRSDVLCVVWEGTLMETSPGSIVQYDVLNVPEETLVFQSGDWLGPIALQPDQAKSGASQSDVSAVSRQGAKVVLLQMEDLEKILLRGSELYRRYLSHHQEAEGQPASPPSKEAMTRSLSNDAMTNGRVGPVAEYVMHALNANSVFAHLSPLIKRSLESIAEGPRRFEGGSLLWEVGNPCDKAFLIVSGTATHAGLPNLSSAEESLPSQMGRSLVGTVVEVGHGRMMEVDRPLSGVTLDSEYGKLEYFLALRARNIFKGNEVSDGSKRKSRQRAAQNRFLNKVLARLYTSRRYVMSLTYSKGCFLCDASRMVSGELVLDSTDAEQHIESNVHTSSVVAGDGGCVAYEFPRSTLIQLLDANPGLLLSLLGTQVVV